jgi:hypothetical protein
LRFRLEQASAPVANDRADALGEDEVWSGSSMSRSSESRQSLALRSGAAARASTMHRSMSL